MTRRLEIPRGLPAPSRAWMTAVEDSIEKITGRKHKLPHLAYIDDVPTKEQFNALVDAFNALLDRLQS